MSNQILTFLAFYLVGGLFTLGLVLGLKLESAKFTFFEKIGIFLLWPFRLGSVVGFRLKAKIRKEMQEK